MIGVETGHFIKGMHNLLNAHFDLRNYNKLALILKDFEKFAQTPVAQMHDNNRIQTFVYINSAKLNLQMSMGNFKEGLLLIPEIEQSLDEYSLYLDRHRVLVFTYKIATLHFGSGNYETSIDYLQKIINDNLDLRNDLQCYSRVLHLMAHYELGNHDIIDHLIKSVYRFMAKKKNFTVIEEEMFKFLRKSFHVPRRSLKPALQTFLDAIKKVEKSRFETRAFSYLDIVSWVESKLEDKPMSQIIREKYLASNRKLR
jgi:tetratricopeptide (TPR) repeat protein